LSILIKQFFSPEALDLHVEMTNQNAKLKIEAGAKQQGCSFVRDESFFRSVLCNGHFEVAWKTGVLGKSSLVVSQSLLW